jgi:rod shape determining protein RodA
MNRVFNRKLLRDVDWVLYVTVLLTSLFGVVVIASASANNAYSEAPLSTAILESLRHNKLVQRQLLFILVGQIALLVVLTIDYQVWTGLTYPIFLGNLALLGAVLVIGSRGGAGGGAQRWIRLGGFVLQPSELAKIAVILTMARVLERMGKPDTLMKLLLVGAHVAVPMALIVVQPDLGTSIVFIAITVAMLYGAGLTPKLLALLAAGASVAAPLIWFKGLRNYQRLRLLVFLDPGRDPTGEGYHLLQSIIAVGSGMVMGRGLFRGPQAQLSFLPEQQTDFVFSVIGEELGFLGTLSVIVVLFFIVYRVFRIAELAKDAYGRYIAIGVGTLLAFQAIVNTGMTAGVMPITGLPLPFLSAGGSSYLAISIGIGLVLNIGMRRRKIMF